MLLIFVLSATTICAVELPNEPDTVIINKVDQEHKNTRQFVSNELTKKQMEFLNEFTTRADYYEGTYFALLRQAVWKLGLLWAGLMFFFVSFNKIITLRIEEKKYQVLKESLKIDLINEFKTENIEFPEKDIALYESIKKKREEEKKPEQSRWSKSAKTVKKEKKKKMTSKEKDDVFLKMAEFMEGQKQPSVMQKMKG